MGCLSGQMGTAVSPAGQGSRVPQPGNHVLFGPCSAVKGCHSTRAKSHFRKEKNDLAGHSQMLIRAVGVGGAAGNADRFRLLRALHVHQD